MSPLSFIFLTIFVILISAALFYLFSESNGNGAKDEAWVSVAAVGDTAELVFLKSILEEAKIPYATVGERAQDLFGMGRLGTGYNMITGPVRLQVPAPQASEAKELIANATKD